ncbi:MAG TPA: division/cell wall cluster transcriptional repressor MraZ [Planctomycetota bacterium]|nr:division/cell wall cluster transcriptional repressor MraZ [Planctomycetota bacterium]HRR80658.1 division/cell wall cluster transcriptional repressor MraZ [Planctomycetota bacterium]HRT95017.1 division/cell wall cluster transcriptional repressor MraZ [Planctomycetota bacterium]
MRFFGQFAQRLDAERRVMLPKAFRAAIGESDLERGLMLARGLDGCIWLFTMGAWEAAVAELGQRVFASTEARMLERLFLGGAVAVSVDRLGRIPLPEGLCARAGITGEVLLIGAATRVEIWDPARWRALENEALGRYEELAERLA